MNILQRMKHKNKKRDKKKKRKMKVNSNNLKNLLDIICKKSQVK